MADLSLVPVEKLADELVTRGHTGIVFVAGLGTDGLGYANWIGDYHKALGLCEDMKDHIKKETNEASI